MPRKRKEGTRAPNGAASIYEGADGRWHGRVTMGVKDDGKPDRRHVSAKTETEVIAKVRKLERDRDEGTVKKPGKPWTVTKWLTHWIENIIPGTVADNTPGPREDRSKLRSATPSIGPVVPSGRAPVETAHASPIPTPPASILGRSRLLFLLGVPE